MPSGVGGLVAALFATAAVSAGCGGTPESAEPAPHLAARVLQSRLDQSIGSIRVQITNEGAEPVHVDDLVLHAPPFPDTASEDDSVIRPERRIDFRADYREPTCSGATPTPDPATAEVVVDGRRVQVDVEDSQDVLRRLLALHCSRQRLAEVVTVSLGRSWTPEPAGDALLGTVELHRVGSGLAVTLERLSGSVSYGVEPVRPAQPVATLAAGEDTVSVPVRARAKRCEPHARAEDKKKYDFPMWFGLAGAQEAINVELHADPGLRTALELLCDALVDSGVES
jgi:hypothetical protein